MSEDGFAIILLIVPCGIEIYYIAISDGVQVFLLIVPCGIEIGAPALGRCVRLRLLIVPCGIEIEVQGRAGGIRHSFNRTMWN